MTMTGIEIAAAVIFVVAVLHTFSTRLFEHLARLRPEHAGIFHLLGEVEVVFGFWALILIVVLALAKGGDSAIQYVESRNFTEPLFVFAIMVVSGSRPVIDAARLAILGIARLLPMPRNMAVLFAMLGILPLFGSLITEPAAMTLAALSLKNRFFLSGVSSRFKYAVLAVLLVNISIGGTLTSYAAPPVLMVAPVWGWDFSFMMTHFGWKAAIAALFNAIAATLLFRKVLAGIPEPSLSEEERHVPIPLMAAHLCFLGGIVAFSHHAPIFLGLFLFFMGVATAYPKYQSRLILREGLLVAFFLAGLVVIGGLQETWLRPLLLSLDEKAVFFGAIALTAITDNAALTYLGSLASGVSEPFKYALVSGAVTGGGLTIIANVPNPAGIAILRGRFEDGAVSPWRLFLFALLPTLVAAAAFRLL